MNAILPPLRQPPRSPSPPSPSPPAHPAPATLQVVRCALENAASVAKTFLTSSVVVTAIPEPEGAGAPAGMDAMGGY